MVGHTVNGTLSGAVVKLPWGPRSGKYLAKEPMQLIIPAFTAAEKMNPDVVVHIGVELVFMGHYNEPVLPVRYRLDPRKSSGSQVYSMAFDPTTGLWNEM